MMYISKGVVKAAFDKESMTVNHRGADVRLDRTQAPIWLAGQYMAQEFKWPNLTVNELIDLGVVVMTEEDGPLGRYRLLTDCVIAPAENKLFRKPIKISERNIWEWISKAGIRPTVAELICLEQNQIEPAPELLGEENRQNLVSAIYSSETIGDNILEGLMEHSTFRDDVVDTIYGLLKKKRIILI